MRSCPPASKLVICVWSMSMTSLLPRPSGSRRVKSRAPPASKKGAARMHAPSRVGSARGEAVGTGETTRPVGSTRPKWGSLDLNLLVVFDAVMQERSVSVSVSLP
jgi:hypothetical protein